MRKALGSILILTVLAVLIWGIRRTYFSGAVNQESVSFTHAPDFLIYDLENRPIRLSDFKGKLLLLNFWATWCPPCVEEIPHLEKLFQNYSKRGLVVLGISLDEVDNITVQTFVKKNEMTYPVAMSQKKLEKDFGGIRAIPTSFLIDRNGKIIKKWVGYRDYNFFEFLMKEHL